MGGVDISLPNVSYCKDVKDVHYLPYNLIKFYVGEITEAQTIKIYTDKTNSVDVTVSEANRWYTYVLPKDKGLCKIEGDSVKKVVVKANISFQQTGDFLVNIISFIPSSTVEASFKGSNTTNVTDMFGMFKNCRSLTSLDVSNFNTSNVTNMSYMFYGCRSLTSLDVSNFNTSNVTNMGSMFDGCSGLTSLDLSNFNTSNVTDMIYMFYGCSGLTSLDLSNFNTSNLSYTSRMFGYCTNLTSLDLSKWDISNVNIINTMFYGCTSLKTIKMVGCSEVTVNKIKAQLTEDNITGVTIVTE